MGHGYGPGSVVGAAVLAAVVATGAGAAAPPKKPAAPGPVKTGESVPAAPAVLHLRPQARQMSTYTLEGRFEITAREVSFEAPEAYRDGFKFWSDRMKGQKRSEVCEMLTITQDADGNGVVPFRRTLPKYDVEFERQGQIFTPGTSLERDVATFVWEGTLDPYGNVKTMNMVTGKDDPQYNDLAIPEISALFPRIEGARDLKVGESFKEERVARLPTKLNISGLEKITLRIDRVYILKSVSSDVATFEIKTTYATDPAFKSSEEKTTCSISGGGSGEAVFEIKRGVFQESRQPTSMHVDIVAPLRPLPNHPETQTPTLGKTHIDLDLLQTGRQTVKRVWGEEPD